MVEADVPHDVQVLRMATVGGARPRVRHDIARGVGRAAEHGAARWDSIAYPYLDEETPLLDA